MPSADLAVEVEADDFGDQHGLGLAEHGSFCLNAANAPAQNSKAVDHGGVRIGADHGIRIGDSRSFLAVLIFLWSRRSGQDIQHSPGGKCRCLEEQRGNS